MIGLRRMNIPSEPYDVTSMEWLHVKATTWQTDQQVTMCRQGLDQRVTMCRQGLDQRVPTRRPHIRKIIPRDQYDDTLKHYVKWSRFKQYCTVYVKTSRVDKALTNKEMSLCLNATNENRWQNLL